MAAIVAYEDFQRFRVLPRAGGTFDQDADLMDELRIVADRVHAVREQKAKAELDRIERTRKRRMGH